VELTADMSSICKLSLCTCGVEVFDFDTALMDLSRQFNVSAKISPLLSSAITRPFSILIPQEKEEDNRFVSDLEARTWERMILGSREVSGRR
jgi:hypothetical protein